MKVDLDRDAALHYVLSRRTPQGGYSFYRESRWGIEEPNAPDTFAALRSLRLLDAEPPEVNLTVQYLRGLQDEWGGYPTLTIGWAALLGLDELNSKPHRSATSWLHRRLGGLLEDRRQRDWSGVVTGLARVGELMEILRIPLERSSSEAVARALAQARSPEGAWARCGADLELTALVVRLSARLNLALGSKDRSDVESLMAQSQDVNFGFCVGPHTKAVSVGSLWGGLEIGHVLGYCVAYPRAVAASLVLLQRRDGGLGRRHRAISTLRDTWRGLEAARLLVELKENQL